MQKSEGPKSVLPEHILVAEDDQIQSHSLSLTLKRAGYSVTAVKDGHMALRKILSFKKEPRPVDLIIADIQMPRLTGTELISELDRLGISLPILVISGYGKETVNGLQRKRWIEYIDKPFSPEELLERVSRLLKKDG